MFAEVGEREYFNFDSLWTAQTEHVCLKQQLTLFKW